MEDAIESTPFKILEPENVLLSERRVEEADVGHEVLQVSAIQSFVVEATGNVLVAVVEVAAKIFPKTVSRVYKG